ncbi:RNA polymerase sigma-70 factor [uncultured Roseivirga sp.]|uniref:RNA polymerase sigma-70 factor n=1 Tax=uncultured Roseivirga sp. TaxID=543088 RepID=UPI000D78CD41|nr:RNA polymerase sigma-70 factor [uncultured Roseivirga sp.]PWL30792.1 MAG: RNA polymerase sigma-70 factor [Roseivirga sp. XM-24bin3]
MSNQQDVALQQRLSRGDETAFQETFELYFKVLVLFATKFSLDKEAAEDLVQDVFVKLYEQRDRLQFHSSLKAFLYQSVRNRCIDLIRSTKTREKHHVEIKADTDVEGLNSEELMLQSELEEKIYQSIKQLPEQCQLIFKMNRFEGKKNQEIANELNISKRTVETQISKALKRLREDIYPYLKAVLLAVSFWIS